MVGPPPKSDAATFSAHVLGVGACVCAAKAVSVKEPRRTADNREVSLFIEISLEKFLGLRQISVGAGFDVVNGSRRRIQGSLFRDEDGA